MVVLGIDQLVDLLSGALTSKRGHLNVYSIPVAMFNKFS